MHSLGTPRWTKGRLYIKYTIICIVKIFTDGLHRTKDNINIYFKDVLARPFLKQMYITDVQSMRDIPLHSFLKAEAYTGGTCLPSTSQDIRKE